VQVVWGLKEDPQRLYLKQHWSEWLGKWLGGAEGAPPPEPLLDRCCAQFVVHRDRVRRLPLAFYQEALGEREEGPQRLYLCVCFESPDPVIVRVDATDRMYRCTGGREESRLCGLLMEWVWHLIFGEVAVQDEELRPLLPLLPHADRLSITKRSSCLRREPRDFSAYSSVS
jgi:hypothetical protein